MRVLVIAPFALVVCVALADQTYHVVLYETKDAQGHVVQYCSDTDTLWKKPMGTPGGEGPPLSLEAATKIAMDTGLRQVPKSNGISFGDIKLLKNAFDYPGSKVVTWFWVFSVSPVIDEHPDQATEPIVKPARDIVILLDGTVVEPKVVK
jgi:hypothetical protein